MDNVDRSKLIVLAKFKEPSDAHLLKAALDDHGIRAVIANENSRAALGMTIVGPVNYLLIEVLVLDCDAEAALAVRESIKSRLEAEAEEIPEWECGCEETVDAGFAVCWNCGRSYGGDEESS